MMPLPSVPFRAARCHPDVAISSRSIASVEGEQYSVWSWARRETTVYAGVDEITLVMTGDRRTVVHPRQPFGGRAVDYRHYLRELSQKPQALRQVVDELIVGSTSRSLRHDGCSSTSTGRSKRHACSRRFSELSRCAASEMSPPISRLHFKVVSRFCSRFVHVRAKRRLCPTSSFRPSSSASK